MREYQLDTNGKLRNEFVLQSNMNFFQRVIGIIFSPSKTIMDLIAKPRILFAILSLALGLVTLQLIRYNLYADQMMQALERSLNTNPSVSVEQLEQYSGVLQIAGLLGTAINKILVWFLTGLALWGVVKLFKGEGKLKQYLSIIGYSGVITLLYYALSAAVSFLTGRLMLDDSLANITNLFAPSMKGSYIYGIFRAIGFFNIWYYFIIATGIALLNKISKTKAYSITAFVFIIEVLLNAMEYRYM